MRRIGDLMPPALLEQMLREHFVTVRHHPTLPLQIYNYTARAQYDWTWNAVTRQCRGLITDDDGIVVGRGLDKFFSLEQLEIPLPDEPFTVHEKLDGSLIIVCKYGDQWVAASRGSFTSDQARWAQQILGREFENGLELAPSSTYYFELIHPANRIVVDYGDDEKLVLLAEFETETGAERQVHEYFYPTVPLARTFDFTSVPELIEALETDEAFKGQEGFVLRYRSGLRVKVKSSEYLHYHRLVTRVTPKRIWEHLSSGLAADRLVNGLWSEPSQWILTQAEILMTEYDLVDTEARGMFSRAINEIATPDNTINRKDFALWVQEHAPSCAPLLFALWDDKPEEVIDQMIWRRIKPRGDEVFRPESEEL